MQQNEASSQRLWQAVVDAFRQPDLRAKLLFTLGILILFRFIANIPVPGVDRDGLAAIFHNNQLLSFLDVFSGGTLQKLSIAAMGVYPYITASIIIQLMVPVIPQLQQLSKEGERGRQQMNKLTHYLTVPLAFGQAYGQLTLLNRTQVSAFSGGHIIQNFGFSGGDLLPTMSMMLTMVAGTMLLVWFAELITEHGIGNGVSLIIFGGIVARLPSLLGQGFLSGSGSNLGGLLFLLAVGVLLVYLIVLFTEAQRRVPVQYGRSLFRGGRVYRQTGSSFIPLRVNSAGMIPLIFAFSIVIFPGIVASYFTSANASWIASTARWTQDFFSPTHFVYWGLIFVLVVGFAFFYTLIQFQQQNLAENLQKQGGFIPGIRPGKPTQDYLTGVLIRITWAGALFLGLVSIAPFFAQRVSNVSTIQISAASMLIVVGVVLDTMRQLEAQLLMRRYEGFIK